MSQFSDSLSSAKAVQKIRDTAVELHERKSSYLESEYTQMRDKGHFASAFTYGRKKIDALLYDVLSQLPAASSVLDIGCGTGEQLKVCRERGFSVAAIEPSSAMRTIARQRNPDTAIVDGCATTLPFDDGRFDLVIAIEVLRYLHNSDVNRAYREMFRVLKPGGKLFITMVNRYALDGFWLHYQIKKLLSRLIMRRDIEHCEFVTPGKMAVDLKGIGLTDFHLYGRMLAPLRIVYKLNGGLGTNVARCAEPLDDRVSMSPWMAAFSGHLIVVATKSRGV